MNPEKFLAASCPYAEFAREAFLVHVSPLVSSLLADGEQLRAPIAAYCQPSASASSYRLFPGSLYLLLKLCTQADNPIDADVPRIAAAIELAHNASLIHDDILDNHHVRRGQPTLLSKYGSGPSLLFGDAAIAIACRLLAELDDPVRRSPYLRKLCDAIEACCLGQLYDEPQWWQSLEQKNWRVHWDAVCRLKLSIGNAGMFLFTQDRTEETWLRFSKCFEEFSLVSQVINDFHDFMGQFGYHVHAKDMRVFQEEAQQKPTLPIVLAIEHDMVTGSWNSIRRSDLTIVMPSLIAIANKMIDEWSAQAMDAIRGLSLQDSPWKSILESYFWVPRLAQPA